MLKLQNIFKDLCKNGSSLLNILSSPFQVTVFLLCGFTRLMN